LAWLGCGGSRGRGHVEIKRTHWSGHFDRLRTGFSSEGSLNIAVSIAAKAAPGQVKEMPIKSSVRPELVEGLAIPIDYYRFNPIMVRQALMEQLSID